MLREVGRKATFYMLKYVKNNCKGGKNMDNTRRIYLDNIRWITVCIVVIYHVIYMYNGVQPFGVIGPFKEQQLQDAFQYFVYPWIEYYGAAEPPVRCGESHLSGLTEPLRSL